MTYRTAPHGFRTFLVIWATQSLSTFGTVLTLFASNIWLAQVLYPLPEQRAELSFALAAINLTYALPILIVAPLAGAWVDRHDRKRTMMIMDMANGYLSLVLIFLLITGSLQLWMLLLILTLFSTLGTFHSLAFDTSYIALVPEHLLPRANGMMQMIWSLSNILAPPIAAGIIAAPILARQGILQGSLGSLLGQLHDGTPLVIAIDSLSFLIASATLFFLHVPSPKRTDLLTSPNGTKKSVWTDIKEGALYIWHRRPLLWLLSIFMVANLLLSPLGILLQLLVKFDLAADWSAQGFTFETAFALLISAFGAGGVAGGIVMSAWGGLKTGRIYGVIVPIIIAGGALILLGSWQLLYFAAAMGFVVSAMAAILNAHSQSIWQTQTPSEFQGRVFSIEQVIAQFTVPLGAGMAGLIGGMFQPGLVIAGLGVFLVLFCIAQLFNPYLLRVEDKPWLDQAASRAAAKSRIL